MADDPVAELEELLETGTEESVEWWVSRDFVGGAEPEEVAAARVQCLRVYERTVAEVAEAWGPPDFRGSLLVEDGELIIPSGYPWSLCEFANELTVWHYGTLRACVWWEQQDEVTPFSVFVGVTEPNE